MLVPKSVHLCGICVAVCCQLQSVAIAVARWCVNLHATCTMITRSNLQPQQIEGATAAAVGCTHHGATSAGQAPFAYWAHSICCCCYLPDKREGRAGCIEVWLLVYLFACCLLFVKHLHICNVANGWANGQLDSCISFAVVRLLCAQLYNLQLFVVIAVCCCCSASLLLLVGSNDCMLLLQLLLLMLLL